MRAAAVLLGAGCLVWAALPAVHRGYATFALAVAIAGVAVGGLRLALAAVPVPEQSYWPSPGVRAWRAFLDAVRLVPWDGEESLDLPLAAHTRRPMAARR